MDLYEKIKSELPKRKSPRAKWLEYNDGMYFITVCTNERKHLFGEINDGKMELTKIGIYLTNELEHAPLHHPHIKVLQYVIMPNHFHAIIEVAYSDAARSVPTSGQRASGCVKGANRPLLSSYIGSLKSAVTKYAHECGYEFAWQSRYHDHLIRGVEDGNNIASYIENNVANWEKDCFY